MTQTQHDVMVKVETMLREHFDASVCIVQANEGAGRGRRLLTSHGGQATWVGMLALELVAELLQLNKGAPPDFNDLPNGSEPNDAP